VTGARKIDQAAREARAQALRAEVRAWARAWAASVPRWSDERWEEINTALGYRVRRGARAGKPTGEDGRTGPRGPSGESG
jgi:hypothetical protein